MTDKESPPHALKTKNEIMNKTVLSSDIVFYRDISDAYIKTGGTTPSKSLRAFLG